MAKRKWALERQRQARKYDRFWRRINPNYVRPPMEIGELCTRCGTKLTLLGTTNPWQFYCRTCDERYQSVDCKQSLREHQAAEEWVRAFDRS